MYAHLANVRRFLKCFTPVAMGLVFTVILLTCLAYPAVAKPIHQNISASQFPITDSITITIWYAYAAESSEEQALSQVVLNAKSNFSNLIIQAERKPFEEIFSFYQAAALSGSGPDLLLAPNDSLGDHARSGAIKDLTAYLDRLGSVYATTAIDGMKLDGKLYGIPESAKAVALYYDTQSIPTPPTSTAQLLDMVKSGKKIAIGTGRDGSYYNFGLFGAFGGQLLDDKGKTIADQGNGFVSAMQYLVDLQKAGAIIKSNYLEASDLFKKSEVDMLIDGPWRLYDYRSVRANFSIALLPSGPTGPATPLNGIDGFYVNPYSKYITTSVELALFMTNQQSAQQFTNIAGHVPIRSDVSAGNDTLVKTFALASEQGLPRPQLAEFSSYWNIFGNMFTQVLSGTVSPAVGVQAATREMNLINGFTTTIKIYLPLTTKN